MTEPKFVIDQVLPVGVTLLHGKPKAGLSWLALDLAYAVASGGQALGRYQAPAAGGIVGDVLYIDTVSNERRMHERLHRFSPGAEPPARLFFAFSWPVGEAFTHQLYGYLCAHPFVNLVVVDELAPLLAPQASDAELRAVGAALSGLAHQFGIAILFTQTTRKAGGSPVCGLNGLVGSIDAVLELRRDELHGDRGRLRQVGRKGDKDFSLSWDETHGSWRVAGD